MDLASASDRTTGGTHEWEYDDANNPTKIGTRSYAYDAADELETRNSYTYNEEGALTKTTPTKAAATTYGYDQAGNLTSVSRPEEGGTKGISDTYTYDGNGLRASQTIGSEGTKYMVWDMAESTPQILNDGQNSYIYGPNGLPIEQINSEGKALYLHHDQQGSTRLLTGSTGIVEGAMTYDPYGNLLASSGTKTTPLGYDGQYTNSDTGLIYLRAREYNPAIDQFLSVDPLKEITEEPYSYASDDPVNLSDPSGLSSWNPFSESFWTEGNVVSESPLNPIPYYEEEVESYENGCGYFASVAHGVEGAFAGAALFAGGEGADEGDIAVSDVLKGKLGKITRAPLPPGAPSWADIANMTMADVRAAAKANEPGFKAIYKLLTEGKYNKP